jgi:hypothetical protein
MPRGVRAEPPEDVAAIVEGLVGRKSEIDARLEELGVNETPIILSAEKASAAATKRGRRSAKAAELGGGDSQSTDPASSAAAAASLIPYTPKADTHWDFVMKEMMWLGADFQGERKRQHGLAKKLANRYVLKRTERGDVCCCIQFQDFSILTISLSYYPLLVSSNFTKPKRLDDFEN